MASSSSARGASPPRSSPPHSSPPSPPNPSPISRVMRRATAASRRQIRRARRRPVRPEPSALRALLIRFPEHDASTVSALLSRHAGDAAAVTALLQRARAAPPSAPNEEQAEAISSLPPPTPPPPSRPLDSARRVSGVKRLRQDVRPGLSSPPPLPPLSPPPSRTPPAIPHHRAATPPSPLLTPSLPHPRRSRSFDPSPVFAPSLPPSAASISISTDAPPASPAHASALIQQLANLENRLHVFLVTSRQQHVAIRRALHQAQVDLQSLRATHNVLRVEVEETTSRVSRADDFLDRLRRDVQTALLAKRNTAVNRVRGLALHVFYTVLSVTVRLVFFVGTLGKRAWIAVRRDSQNAPKPQTQT